MRPLFALVALTGILSGIVPASLADSCKEKTAPAADLLQTAASTGQFKTLLTALVATGLDDALKTDGPFTVFAPSDQAFARLPKGTLEELLKPENKKVLASILKLHVVAGRLSAAQLAQQHELTTLNGAPVSVQHVDHKLRINQATVIKADLACRNGVIHVIDEVLLPKASKRAAANLRQTAEKSGKFTVLLKAIDAAGLTSALEGADALTVLAPTDEAFHKLPAGTLEKLLKPENKEHLAALLKYHVIGSKVTARAAVNAGQARTLQGKTVEFRIGEDGRLAVNDSRVLTIDLMASNGIIHVIDTVLVP